MTEISAVRSVTGNAYIYDATTDADPWCDGGTVRVEVERSDEDEIRLGAVLRGDDSDSATIFLQRSEALRLVIALAQAIGDR